MVLAVSCREEETKPISLGICWRISLYTHVSVQFICSDILRLTERDSETRTRLYMCVCARSCARV